MTLTGKLLDGNDAYRWIADALSNAEQPIDICSAFLRSEALSALLHGAPKSLSGRILVRWRLNDFLMGASDIEAYEIAVSYGLVLYMRLDFHGKVYALPPNGVVVGSANATRSGLGLSQDANAEICTLITHDTDAKRVIDELYSGARLVDENLLLQLKDAYSQVESVEALDVEWPSCVLRELEKRGPVKSLLVDECFWSSPVWVINAAVEVSSNFVHDQTLLGVILGANSSRPSKHLIETSFRNLSVYKWLLFELECNGGEMFFGQLSASMHSLLADDPTPSRQSVKQLLQNLLDWVAFLAPLEVRIDRPRYSQRIRMVV